MRRRACRKRRPRPQSLRAPPFPAPDESRTPCTGPVQGSFGDVPTPLKACPALTFILGALLVNGTVALWLWTLGRNVLPTEAPLQWLSFCTGPEGNSQHLADIYSFAHAVSGAGLYVFLQGVWFFRPLWQRLLAAIASSGMWEVVENTPWVIALFNGAPGPGTCRGDSIVNALSDTAFVTLGFLVARHMPLWAIAVFSAFVGGLFVPIPR
ncbi:DUF2585 family protein [Paracoccus sp. SSK6]|uniref:DUF2585 family protein n=1 Tax=Paracoccus sp. SSK6 TaxID=3143131 RepID=UPI00321938B1